MRTVGRRERLLLATTRRRPRTQPVAEDQGNAASQPHAAGDHAFAWTEAVAAAGRLILTLASSPVVAREQVHLVHVHWDNVRHLQQHCPVLTHRLRHARLHSFQQLQEHAWTSEMYFELG